MDKVNMIFKANFSQKITRERFLHYYNLVTPDSLIMNGPHTKLMMFESIQDLRSNTVKYQMSLQKMGPLLNSVEMPSLSTVTREFSNTLSTTIYLRVV